MAKEKKEPKVQLIWRDYLYPNEFRPGEYMKQTVTNVTHIERCRGGYTVHMKGNKTRLISEGYVNCTQLKADEA